MNARLNRMDTVINKMKEEQAVIQNPNTTVINMAALNRKRSISKCILGYYLSKCLSSCKEYAPDSLRKAIPTLVIH